MMAASAEKFDPADSPTAWFAVLEAARRRGDHARAKRADDELRRLGVRVEFVELGRSASEQTSQGDSERGSR